MPHWRGELSCRRAERDVVTLCQIDPINPQVVIYLNRLSDLLFVLGRVYNNNGQDDVLWHPGKGQAPDRPPAPRDQPDVDVEPLSPTRFLAGPAGTDRGADEMRRPPH